jgi:hypothetical protein
MRNQPYAPKWEQAPKWGQEEKKSPMTLGQFAQFPFDLFLDNFHRNF